MHTTPDAWLIQAGELHGASCSIDPADVRRIGATAVAELLQNVEDLAPWSLHEATARCPLCEDESTVAAAIDIVIDGDQISFDCYGCGRIVRPFSWHDDDGLPECYLGQAGTYGQMTEITAVYGAGGAVRSVPAVDPDRPDRHLWLAAYTHAETARAILAHLVGLDVPTLLQEEFDADMISTLEISGCGEWELLVDDIADWLAANR